MEPQILHKEIKFRMSRSSGSGGQHLNKVSTKVELLFDIEGSKILNEDQKRLILLHLSKRISKNGRLQLSSQYSRSQLLNRKAVLKKFERLISEALQPKKKRKKILPLLADRRKRLKNKRLHSEKKSLRKKPLLFLFLVGLLFSCNSNPYRQGELLYQNYCANCHMDDGSGLQGLIPPLAGSDFVKNEQAKLPCIIRYGIEGSIMVNDKTYKQSMAAIPQLTEFEIANIINFINQAFGNDFGFARINDINQSLQNCR